MFYFERKGREICLCKSYQIKRISYQYDKSIHFSRRETLSLHANRMPMVQKANPTEIRFNKAECGVDFLINTGTGKDHLLHYASDKEYVTDFFEFVFFEEGGGHVWIEHKRYDVKPDSIVFLSPYQRHKWRLETDAARFRFLIFQEDFLHNFLADKYFTYRLLYCYPNDTPPVLLVTPDDMQRHIMPLKEIKKKLRRTISDSEQILRSLLFYLLLQINRSYAASYVLPTCKAQNNYAYQFRQLLEKHIRTKHKVNDYADLAGITRITLNKAVKEQFGTTAVEMLRKRLLLEVRHELIDTGGTASEVAYRLNFPEPNHLMRFFKQMTGQTIGEFLIEARQEE